jgi:hypothetical protein
MVPRNRLYSIGWATLLVIAFALFGALTIKVNSVKSQVRQAERQIVTLRQQQDMLETEFQTRASQQQLADWNEVDFGYSAPDAAQFLEGERQLAALGTPRGPGAPAPIEVASAPDAQTEGDTGETFPQMVSPLTGQAFAAEATGEANRPRVTARDLSDRLSERATRVSLSAHAGLGAGVSE